MTYADILDKFPLTPIKEAISPEVKAGKDLRESDADAKVLFDIKELRSDSLSKERDIGVMQDSAVVYPSEWEDIIALGYQTLCERSIDMEVMAWLLEALVRLYHFAGLRYGLTVLHAILATFPEQAHPQPDEESPDQTLYLLGGLNGYGKDGTIIPVLRMCPLVDGDGYICLWIYTNTKDGDKGNNTKSKGEILKIIGQTNTAFTIELRDDIDASITLLKDCEKLMHEQYGSINTPSFSRIHDILKQIKGFVNQFYASSIEAYLERTRESDESHEGEDHADEQSTSDTDDGKSSNRFISLTSIRVKSREDAIVLISKALDYYLESEPHSPIGASLSRIMRWAEMQADELWAEIIQDKNVRDSLNKVTGVTFESK